VQLSYGASEIGPNVSILSRPDPDAARRGTSGTILPHTAVRLVGPDGNDVPRGAPGEVWVRGPGVTPGYWKQPRDESFAGEWFRTGDAARLDDAGHLYVVGRVKEMYRSGGENVYPAEVEAVLRTHPDVVDCAVLPWADEQMGQVGWAAAPREAPRADSCRPRTPPTLRSGSRCTDTARASWWYRCPPGSRRRRWRRRLRRTTPGSCIR